jgi:hypothetical protein
MSVAGELSRPRIRRDPFKPLANPIAYSESGGISYDLRRPSLPRHRNLAPRHIGEKARVFSRLKKPQNVARLGAIAIAIAAL